MKRTALKKYANLIVKVGLNVQRSQDVIINAGLDQPEFVTFVAGECYKAGARKVTVEWSHEPLTKMHIKNRSLQTLSELESWEIEKRAHRAKTLPAVLHLISDDPDGMRGVNQDKLAKSMQAKYPIIKPFEDAMENRYQWCIAAVPGEAWAKKIFPGESGKRAVEKLWEAILYTSRADEYPITAWAAHNENLKNRCDYLNSLGLTALEYSSPNGTKLRVGLIEEALFLGGGEYTLGGNFFNPNIPTEEVFTTPRRGDAEGIACSTRPLSYRGELIENFSIRFEGGRAVEARAAKNEALLNTLIAMDEGAAFLGECALVPFDSPIQNSGIMFYNTLFDENAACHLALGRGFTNCIRNYERYSLEECRAMGVNDSMVHEDFMIGSDDLDIDGVTKDGERKPLFRNGNWAF